MGKGRKLFALAAALTIMAMVVTGCGSKATGGGDKGVTLKIGIGAPLTQGAVPLGEGIERGAKLAIKQANESQELKDLGITLVSESIDDAGKDTIGVNGAKKLVADQSVIGIVGHLNSGVSIPTSAVYKDAGVSMVSPASTNPDLTKQGFANVFRVCTIDTVQGSFAGDFAFNTLGFKKVAIVDDSTQYGEGLADEFEKKFKELGGEVLTREKTTDKEVEFSTLVTKIKAKNPDFVYMGGMFTQGGPLTKQMKEAGLKVPLMGGDGMYDGDFIKSAGSANAEGDFATSVGLPLELQPKGQEFKAAFDAEYPGKPVAAYDTYAYDAANVIIEAIKVAAAEVGADKLTSREGKDAIVKAIAATKYAGVTGEVAFDANGDTTNKAITAYTVKDGAWVPFEK